MSISCLMKPKLLICLFLTLAIILGPLSAAAMETDQYNLPPVPLADIGDEVSEYVEQNLAAAIDHLNSGITVHEQCLDKDQSSTTQCGSTEKEQAELARLRSEDAVAKAVYERLGE